MAELSARESIILAIDTSEERDAERLTAVAKDAGARFIKLGLELSSATSWRYCSELAASYGLEWVADAKLDDIPDTVARSVSNFTKLEHKPFGITVHTTAGIEAMRMAQAEADTIKILGVTVLTSMDADEAVRIYRVPPSQKAVELAYDAATAGIGGVVASPREVGLFKKDPHTRSLFAMIPGTRSINADHGDQARVATPAMAIADGADLLVIGRQITQAVNPAQAYEELVMEIEGAMQTRETC